MEKAVLKTCLQLVKGIAHVTTSVQPEGLSCLVHSDSISKSDVRKGACYFIVCESSSL